MEAAMKRTLLLLALISCGGACVGEAGEAQEPGVTSNDRQVLTCDNAFHWFGVTGTRCLNGTATGFSYRCFSTVGANGPLVINFDGGGACFDGDSCDCGPNNNACPANLERNHFTATDAATVVPAVFAQANYSGSTSGFNQSWNQVFIPYCTGDVHAGYKVQTYTKSGGGKLTAYHYGYNNVGLDLAQLGSLFPTPAKVALWGSSAGGLGTDCNLGAIRQKWPNAKMYEMNDGAAPFVDAEEAFLATAGNSGVWGIYYDCSQYLCENIPQPPYQMCHTSYGVCHYTCPFNNYQDSYDLLPSWDTKLHLMWNSSQYTTVFKALTDDYSDATMNLFSNLFDCADSYGQAHGDNPCATEPSKSMNADYTYGLVIDTAGHRAPNYKVFFHTGACHAERESNGNPAGCNYDDMTQAGVRFNSWVRGWLGMSGFTWNDVR
jgi:hypothetical protein